jgi:hypothetical protein
MLPTCSGPASSEKPRRAVRGRDHEVVRCAAAPAKPFSSQVADFVSNADRARYLEIRSMPSHRAVAAPLLLLLAAGCVPAAPQLAPGPDSLRVAGLKLGMSPPEVEAALVQFDQVASVRFQIHKIPGTSAAGNAVVRTIDAEKGGTDPSASAQQIVVMFTRAEPPRAYAIVRGSGLSKSDQLSLQWHLAKMRQNFASLGPPSYVSTPPDATGLDSTRPGAYVNAWMYDSKHAKIAATDPEGEKRYNLCGRHGDPRDTSNHLTARQIAGASETYLSDTLQVPKQFDPACGISYRQQLIVGPGSNLVSQWSQELISDELATVDMADMPDSAASSQPPTPAAATPTPAVATPTAPMPTTAVPSAPVAVSRRPPLGDDRRRPRGPERRRTRQSGALRPPRRRGEAGPGGARHSGRQTGTAGVRRIASTRRAGTQRPAKPQRGGDVALSAGH